MLRLHRIIDGPGKDNPCEVCLFEHTHCANDECNRPHVYLLDEGDYARLVRTGSTVAELPKQKKFSADDLSPGPVGASASPRRPG